jgi:hypothetical protein
MIPPKECQSSANLDAPFQDREDLPPDEIVVTDPTHPLFGRRFPVVSVSTSAQARGFVLVMYRSTMLLRIPIPATSLRPGRRGIATKLTLEAVTDFLACAGESEDACPSTRLASVHRRPALCHRQ